MNDAIWAALLTAILMIVGFVGLGVYLASTKRVLAAIAEALKETADVFKVVIEGAEDGQFDVEEVKKVRAEVEEMKKEWREVIEELKKLTKNK